MTAKRRIVVSACLLGVCCNYKAEAAKEFSLNAQFWESLTDRFEVFPVCPEQLGGLSTPRIPSELLDPVVAVISGSGKIIARNGEDVSAAFLKGARETLRIAALVRADAAVLKSRSPSCGKNMVYDGTFSGKLVDGSGVAAYMLINSGLEVYDEQEFLDYACSLSSS